MLKIWFTNDTRNILAEAVKIAEAESVVKIAHKLNKLHILKSHRIIYSGSRQHKDGLMI